MGQQLRQCRPKQNTALCALPSADTCGVAVFEFVFSSVKALKPFEVFRCEYAGQITKGALLLRCHGFKLFQKLFVFLNHVFQH